MSAVIRVPSGSFSHTPTSTAWRSPRWRERRPPCPSTAPAPLEPGQRPDVVGEQDATRVEEGILEDVVDGVLWQRRVRGVAAVSRADVAHQQRDGFLLVRLRHVRASKVWRMRWRGGRSPRLPTSPRHAVRHGPVRGLRASVPPARVSFRLGARSHRRRPRPRRRPDAAAVRSFHRQARRDAEHDGSPRPGGRPTAAATPSPTPRGIEPATGETPSRAEALGKLRSRRRAATTALASLFRGFPSPKGAAQLRLFFQSAPPRRHDGHALRRSRARP